MKYWPLNMGVMMILKKITLLTLLISASFLSTCIAGRGSKFEYKLAKKVQDAAAFEEISSNPSSDSELVTTIHERLLKVNTKDYGNYDPTPALVRPPFKLIPN